MNCPSIWIRNQNKFSSKRCLTFLKTRFLFIRFKKVYVRTMIVHTEGKRSRNFFYSLKKYPLKCWFFEVFSLSIPAVLVVGTLPTTLRRCTILGEIVVASVPTIQPTNQGYHCNQRTRREWTTYCTRRSWTKVDSADPLAWFLWTNLGHIYSQLA